MALAKQFYSSFKSYNGWEYYLEIWVEGYSGSASEIRLGAGGPVITYGTDQQDRFSPILSSKLELPFMVTNTTQDAFIKNIREQFNERDVYVHLYRANSSDYSSVAPLWSGYVLMDLSASPDLYYPYPVTLTAVDGLALLKEIDFVQSGTAGSYSDSDMYSSNGRFTYWIKEILLKTGASTTTEGSTQDYKFTTAINWFNSVMPTITQSTDPFYQTKCGTKMFFSKDANGNFTVVNSYDVLLNLLKHWGARIIYWKHIFYIVQIQEYNTAESGTYANPDNINTRTYTKTGSFDSSSDNLGDSYWTRYNLLIDDVTGGIQKLTGTQFNYLPQLKRAQANFLDYGNKNYFGGLPFDITTGQTDVILQDTFEDVSSDGAMLLVLPLDVTIAQQYNGSLTMRLYFRLYITDGATTYYLRYNPTNTPKFYWESSTTVNLNFNQTRWFSPLDNIVGTQTKVGFHQLIEFKDSGGSSLNLSGEWEAYTDIDSWGSSAGSFYFYASVGGFSGNNVQVFTPSLTTVYWTNTLNASYQTPLNPVVIGTTNQQTTGMTGTQFNFTSNNIVSYQSSFNINPFEGKLLIVNTTSSGAIYGSQVMVTPQTATNDVEVVDFGDLIWGDTLLASSEGSLKVWNGSAFVKSNVTGTWGLGSTSGTNSFTEMLLSEYLYGQTKVVETPSIQLVIGETNKNQNDGSGSRPNYVNPIGRLKGYSATGTTPYYIFKSGSFHLLRDEIDYEGYQIIRDTQTVTKTHDIIIGPDVLQDKTNKIGQKTPSSNTLAAKLTQNSYITTISSTKSAYGNDIAVNGIFSSDSNWTKGTGWSIASNKASFSPTGSTSEIKQDILTNALTYKIVVTVSVSAGGLSVKAGSSGSATVLSASGTYEIFSTCSGSTDVIFEASAAFEGYIEKVVVQQQMPITSININAIGTAVFKTNDVLNIANFDGNEINEFTVSSDQGASDTSISVTSKLITEDILEGSIVLVNQNDLAAQYQNKTKGTVAGFTIDADGIAKGGVEITGWLDSDTMSGATANNVPTAESVKAYVDAQVGSADTLQEVTDNGNTTTNSIRIGSSSAPAAGVDLHVDDEIRVDGGNGVATRKIRSSYFSSTQNITIESGSGAAIVHNIGSSEKMRLDSTGLGIGTSSPTSKLVVDSGTDNLIAEFKSSGDSIGEIRISDSSKYTRLLSVGTQFKIMPNDGVEVLVLDGNNNTATFSGQVTIPATPVASTDAASKGYVDAQIGANNDLQEVTDNGATTTNSIMIGSSSSPSEKLHIAGGGSGNLRLDSGGTYYGTYLQAISSLGIKIGNDDYSAFTQIHNDGYQLWSMGGSEKMRLTSGGNLLIGTTTDDGSSKLQVNGAATFSGTVTADTYFQSSDTSAVLATASAGSVILRPNGAGSGTGALTVGVSNTTISNDLKLQLSATTQRALSSTGTDSIQIGDAGVNDIRFKNAVGSVARFLANGNVLIGTTTDDGSSKLQVNGAATFSGTVTAPNLSATTAVYSGGIVYGSTTLSLKNNTGASFVDFNSSGNATFSGNVTTGASLISTNAIIDNIVAKTSGGNIQFKANDGSEQMRLTSGGNLLIGTTTDSAKLTVDETTTNNLTIAHFKHQQAAVISEVLLENAAGADDTGVSLNFKTGFSGYGGKVTVLRTNSPSAGDASLSLSSSGGEAITIAPSKNVLIGTTTDSGAKLNVQGSLQVGVDDTGYDVKFFGATSGRYMEWDESADSLILVDNVQLQLGSSSDIRMLHDGTDSKIRSTTSDLYITQEANDKDIIFQSDDGSGGLATYMTLDGSLADGVNTLGAISFPDKSKIFMGTGNDLRLYHDGSNSYFQNTSGDIIIQNFADDKDIIFKSDDGSGGTTAYLTLDGGVVNTYVHKNMRFEDSVKVLLGTGGDVNLYHDGSNMTMINSTGNMTFTQATDDGDMIFKSDDGSGGVTAYITLDGSAAGIKVDKKMLFQDDVKAFFGTDNDGSVYVNGGNLYIDQDTNNKDIIFRCDDGSGGTGTYITLDGSQTTINLQKNVLIGTTTDSGVYKLDVAGKARVQSVLELDDVLTLNAISTPSDPATNKSSIYMDSADGAIKVKINVGGTVVTRTIASFE